MESSEPRPLGELEHVGVVVADLERARDFFEKVLGLPVESEATLADGALEVVFLRSGAVRVELVEVRDEAARRERLGEAEARVEHLAFRVEDLEAVAEEARARGLELGGGIGPAPPPTPFVAVGSASLFSRPEGSAGVVIQFVQMLDAKE